MGLPEDLVKLLKSEGYKTNETINDFIAIVTEENEEMEEDIEDDADEDTEDPEGLKADR